jgi:alkanesulfonate monooxygenase SsuD/methylene tetrahydromethanopterin reductase-like flavin-dependent oxidoreductase (luciferase family)
MRIGISVSSSYPGVEARQGARYMVERAAAASAAKLDSLFVGDHHVTPTPYYQNSAVLGRMLAAWGPKPAGALYLLPLWHPVLLAEQIATLASIAEGPFVMQCGLGGDPRQAAGMGTRLKDRVPMFEASLDILRRLWAGETVSATAPWAFEEARISPLPPEGVDVWIGAQAEAAVRRSARLGEGWLAAPSLTPAQAAESVNRYRQACAEFGREPKAVAIRRDIFIGASAEEAERVVAPYLEKGYRGFAPEALVYGGVEAVAEQFAAFEALGYTDIIVRNLSRDQSDALATIERLGAVKTLL